MTLSLCLAAVSMGGCSEQAVEERAPRDVLRRRVSKNDFPTLEKRISRIKQDACGCEDTDCADRSMSHIYAFAKRTNGVKLAPRDENVLIETANTAIGCVLPWLRAGDAPTPDH